MDMKLFLGRVEEALRAQPGSVHENDRVKDLEGWDSIGALSLMVLIAEHYGAIIDPNSLSKCETVADIAKLAEKVT